MCTLRRIPRRRKKPYAEDDGFPPQEDPSETTSGARCPTTGEKGGETLTKECEEGSYCWRTASKYHDVIPHAPVPITLVVASAQILGFPRSSHRHDGRLVQCRGGDTRFYLSAAAECLCVLELPRSGTLSAALSERCGGDGLRQATAGASSPQPTVWSPCEPARWHAPHSPFTNASRR
jgi:hypothetical protein